MDKNRRKYLNNVIIGKRQLENGLITISEYRPEWTTQFELESQKIRGVLGSKVKLIEHVGSTSVPGLCAKPIIDIVLAVDDTNKEIDYIPYLTTVGYILRVREPEWFGHRMLKGSEPEVNLHVFNVGCTEIDRMLRFRNWLRVYERDRNLYAEEKKRLAKLKWNEVQEYADAKTAIITEIMVRAKVE